MTSLAHIKTYTSPSEKKKEIHDPSPLTLLLLVHIQWPHSGQYTFKTVYFDAFPNFSAKEKKKADFILGHRMSFPIQIKVSSKIVVWLEEAVGETFEPLKNWPSVRERTTHWGTGNSSVTENALLHSSHQQANVLLLTGYVTLLPHVSAWGHQFYLTPQMFRGRISNLTFWPWWTTHSDSCTNADALL